MDSWSAEDISENFIINLHACLAQTHRGESGKIAGNPEEAKLCASTLTI